VCVAQEWDGSLGPEEEKGLSRIYLGP
jgi:hypothetical protein